MPETTKTLEELDKENQDAGHRYYEARKVATRRWNKRREELKAKQEQQPSLPTAAAIDVAWQGLARAKRLASEKREASEKQLSADVAAAKAAHQARLAPLAAEVDKAKAAHKAAVRDHQAAEDARARELRAAYDKERDSYLDTAELRQLAEDAEARRVAWLDEYQRQRAAKQTAPTTR